MGEGGCDAASYLQQENLAKRQLRNHIAAPFLLAAAAACGGHQPTAALCSLWPAPAGPVTAAIATLCTAIATLCTPARPPLPLSGSHSLSTVFILAAASTVAPGSRIAVRPLPHVPPLPQPPPLLIFR